LICDANCERGLLTASANLAAQNDVWLTEVKIMYCSTCGSAIIQGLSYCNRCGARTSGADESGANKLSEASFNTLVGSLIGLPIAGLGIIIGLLVVMKKELGFADPPIMIITFLSFLLLLIAEGGLIWLLLHHTRTTKKTGDDVKLQETTTKELSGAQTRELGEAQAQDFAVPLTSVTENTTRSFEPIHQKPKL